MTEYKQFWVFQVVGGKPFAIQIKGNPIQRHHGGSSVLRSLCTDAEAKRVETEMETHGGKVTSHSPREDEETKEERANMLKIMGPDPVFPCELCPSCSWFDPYLPGLCGAGRAHNSDLKWEPEALVVMMEREKFKEDFDQCPIPLKN